MSVCVCVACLIFAALSPQYHASLPQEALRKHRASLLQSDQLQNQDGTSFAEAQSSNEESGISTAYVITQKQDVSARDRWMHAFGGSFKSLMFVDPAFPNNTELQDMLKDGKINNKYNSALAGHHNV